MNKYLRCILRVAETAFPRVAEASGGAGGFDRGGPRTDHWAVIVPFMSGWTSQMKAYVPAVSAGTW
jgi:hypothetical protein